MKFKVELWPGHGNSNLYLCIPNKPSLTSEAADNVEQIILLLWENESVDADTVKLLILKFYSIITFIFSQ